MWLTPGAIATWAAVGVGKRGGQLQYSDAAIETALTLRLIFHLPLRQTEGFLTSIFGMLGVALSAPDHTTLSRRASGSTCRCVACPSTTVFISSWTAPASRSWAKASGRLRNTAVAAPAVGRSSIWASTDPA